MVDFAGHGEPLGVGERGPIVGDGDPEAGGVGDFGDGGGYMPAAKNVKAWLRKNRLDENFERAAADEAGIVGSLVI